MGQKDVIIATKRQRHMRDRDKHSNWESHLGHFQQCCNIVFCWITFTVAQGKQNLSVNKQLEYVELKSPQQKLKLY